MKRRYKALTFVIVGSVANTAVWGYGHYLAHSAFWKWACVALFCVFTIGIITSTIDEYCD